MVYGIVMPTLLLVNDVVLGIAPEEHPSPLPWPFGQVGLCRADGEGTVHATSCAMVK